jgi:hypothetical protein
MKEGVNQYDDYEKRSDFAQVQDEGGLKDILQGS